MASNLTITARGANTIVTEGDSASGLYSQRTQTGLGSIRNDLENISITTKGAGAHGIYGDHSGIGDIDIDVRNGVIVTERATAHSNPAWGGITLSHGIFAVHRNQGNVDIDVRGGSIETKGIFSYGIYGNLFNTEHGGELSIRTDGGNTVTTTGANGHGIVAYNYGTLDTARTSIHVGGTVTATGAGAQGVRVGVVNADRRTGPRGGHRRRRLPPTDRDGKRFRDGQRRGRVPRGRWPGRHRAEGQHHLRQSGIAILATGTVPAVADDPMTMDIDEAMPAILPKLRVDLNLGGRRVARAIGDDWILNDGGETTIAVNGTVLHDGATGVTGRTARNGAWNVRMRTEGVKVTDRTDPDPANWTISEPAAAVIADRDFSAQDFNERRRPTPPPPPPPMCPEGQVGTPPNCEAPPPPMCPEGQVGTPPNCTEPESDPSGPMFEEEYAPRAALYELVPDFLLRLSGQGPSRTCRATPASPVWVRFAGGQGDYQADRSTTGASYDFDRFETEAGVRAALTKRLTGWAGVRYVRGLASGASPTGGGEIDARGLGSTVGAAWRGANGVYAVGCFAYMGYSLDFASANQGLLRGGVSGRAATLDLEVGKRFTIAEQAHVTPRVWVVGSRVAVDAFTDTVNARVAMADADRVLVGLGMQADTAYPWGEGEVTLRGSVDYERIVSGADDHHNGVGRATERRGHGQQPAGGAERGLSPRPVHARGRGLGPAGVGLRRPRIRRLPEPRRVVLTSLLSPADRAGAPQRRTTRAALVSPARCLLAGGGMGSGEGTIPPFPHFPARPLLLTQPRLSWLVLAHVLLPPPRLDPGSNRGAFLLTVRENGLIILLRETFEKEEGNGVASWTSCDRQDRGKALWTVNDPKGFFSFLS